MTYIPSLQACPHHATPEEQRRDPNYLVCGAQPGEPCTWARRYDGQRNPPFHTERLEAALPSSPALSPDDKQSFDEAVLASGLV